jgi:Domain of unknown function (DUF4232)
VALTEAGLGVTSRLLFLAAALVLVASGCGLGGSSRTVTATTTVARTVTVTVTTSAPPPQMAKCTGSDLSATFAVQPGSAGAGNIVYTLTLTNSSSSTCALAGSPALQLVDKSGNALPTHASPAPGSEQVGKELPPGASMSYDARFSPDVPGTGDQQTGRCQPVATTLRVAIPAGGTVDAQVSPPTSVCEQGTITLRPAA